jgi:hypothetical protein
LLPGFSSEREQRFAFALPEVEGRISLGVFDTAGKLRRTLYVNAAETDFAVGLNGLVATWDGKDDFGQPLAAGRYQVSGYLVPGTVKAEGVAYHFNDWVDGEKAPRIIRIDDFRKRPGGFVVLAESLGNHPVVFRYDQLRGFLWTSHPVGAAAPGTEVNETVPDHGSRPKYLLAESYQAESLSSPAGSRMLAVTDYYVAVLLAGSLHLLDMNDGTTIRTQPERFPHAVCVDASREALFVATAGSIGRVPLPDLDPAVETETPIAFNALAAEGEQMLGASSSSWEIWESADAKWGKLPPAVAASSISFGYDGTFWVTAIDEKDGKPFTGQFNEQGEFLRSYRAEFSPVKVCASTAVEEIAVLEESGSAQRLRVLSLTRKTPDAPGEWTVDFEKVLQDCRRFGIVDGKLAPDAGEIPQTDHVNVALATGGLTASSRQLAVRVTSDHAGLWLETQSGLRLAFLASQPNVRRVVVLFGPGREFLTVYAGDDAVVAEYAVRGLGNIIEIDAGEVELD